MAIGLLAFPAAATATFHEMSIREVYPGGADNASYVELQMWAGGQNFVGGHHLVAYNANGTVNDNFSFASDVASGVNQATILVADTSYGSVFTGKPTPDESDMNLNLSPTGGAVCWIEGSPPDCVAWGNFTGPFPSHVPALVAGSPASPGGVTAGKALRRSITAGCSSLLELGDDTNGSATDFSEQEPNPRSNATPTVEHACPSIPNTSIDTKPANSGPGTNGGKAPQTTLERKPPKRTGDRTPTFRFGSNQEGATFQCRLDRRPFRGCRSPFTTRMLSFGGHTFKVRARDGSGDTDPSPASFRFTVVAKRRPSSGR